MNPFDTIAAYYDLEHAALTADAVMFRQFADCGKSRVLIAGVGTGRLAMPLAQSGCEVVGIDSSAAMLRIAASKTKSLPSVDLIQADMTGFDLSQSFSLVLVPLDTFSLLTNIDDRLRALICFRDHLDDQGLLIVDVVNPLVLPPASENGITRKRFDVFDGTRHVTAYDALDIDQASQAMVMHVTYETKQNGLVIEQETVDIPMGWVYRFELQLLLRLAGLEATHVYGDHDLVKYTANSPRMIVTAVRSQD